MNKYLYGAVVCLFPLLLMFILRSIPTSEIPSSPYHAKELLQEIKYAQKLKQFLKEQGILCTISIRETKGPLYRATFKLKATHEQ